MADDSMWAMASINPHDVQAASIAMDMFVNTDPQTLYYTLRSLLGYCDCGSKSCTEGQVTRSEIVAEGGTPARLPEPEEIIAMQEGVKRILNWFDGILSSIDTD